MLAKCCDCAELLSLIYMNKASMLGSPKHDYTAMSALHCARECLADPLCHAFALSRDVEPSADGVSCRRYDQQSAVVYDDTCVTYFTFNSTLPFQ